MVACGDYHTLVLTRAGEVWACGRGDMGQTGSPRLPNAVREPARVEGLPAVALVAAGSTFSGAVGKDGQVWMWGETRDGRLGYPPVLPLARRTAAPTSLGHAAFGHAHVVQLSLASSPMPR